MRIGDWSSDVCSSDLRLLRRQTTQDRGRALGPGHAQESDKLVATHASPFLIVIPLTNSLAPIPQSATPAAGLILVLAPISSWPEIGRAEGQERVCQFVLVSGSAVT